MQNIYMKRRQAVRFYTLEKDDKDIPSSSGFQLLRPLQKYVTLPARIPRP